MRTNSVIGKEAAGMWHSFGKIDRNTVVKYVWFELRPEMDEESGWYSITQEVYKRTGYEPGKRWTKISEISKSTKKIVKFESILAKDGFTATWPKWDTPPIICPIAY